MAIQWFKNNDLPFLLALSPPLLVRFFGDGPDAATQRLALLVLAFGLAYAWSAVFERQIRRSPQGAQLHFAMLFVLFLPAPVGWVGAVLAVSFGWVFGREIFGGRAILPPALIALAYPVADLMREREPSSAVVLPRLPGVQVHVARGGDEQPRHLDVVALHHEQTEQVGGQGVDGHRRVVRHVAKALGEPGKEMLGARVRRAASGGGHPGPPVNRSSTSSGSPGSAASALSEISAPDAARANTA